MSQTRLVSQGLRFGSIIVAGLSTFAPGCTVAEAPQVECIPVTGGAPGTGGTAGTGGTGGTGGTQPGGSIGGAFLEGEWVPATSNLAGLESECGNITHIAEKPDEDLLLLTVARLGVWGSRNGGDSWEKMGQGPGSDEIINRGTRFIFDPDDPQTFWESGIYNGGGVYKTTDNGVTFKAAGDITHTDLVSIDFTDPERKVMLAGGHETGRALKRSADGGETWLDVGASLPENPWCTWPLVIDANVHLVGCSNPGMLFRSDDAGATWNEIEPYPGGGGSAPLVTSDGAIYWTSPGGQGGVALSTDDGETFTEATPGGVIESAAPLIELPDGRLAGVSRDAIIVSDDQGETWVRASAELTGSPVNGVAYSRFQKAFFVWRFGCGDFPVPVAEDTILRFDWDYETQ